MTFDIDSRMEQWDAASKMHGHSETKTERILKAGQDNLDEVFSRETSKNAAAQPRAVDERAKTILALNDPDFSDPITEEEALKSAEWDVKNRQMGRKGMDASVRPDIGVLQDKRDPKREVTPDHIADMMYFFADTTDYELANNLLKALRGRFPDYYAEHSSEWPGNGFGPEDWMPK